MRLFFTIKHPKDVSQMIDIETGIKENSCTKQGALTPCAAEIKEYC
jgi:hypothetical protein